MKLSRHLQSVQIIHFDSKNLFQPEDYYGRKMYAILHVTFFMVSRTAILRNISWIYFSLANNCIVLAEISAVGSF